MIVFMKRNRPKQGVEGIGNASTSDDYATVERRATDSGHYIKVVFNKYAPLAQLVEQLTLNQWVPGSNP